MRNTSIGSFQRLSDLVRQTQECCSEDINCSTSLFNEQNNKKYGSFSQNKPTLRDFITPSDVDFDIHYASNTLEERPGNITNSSFTGFLLQQMELMREEARFKNFVIERLFTTNSFLHYNQFFSCKSEHIKTPSQSCSNKSNDISDIPLGNSGLNKINHCNSNLIDEPIENFICSDLDVIDEPKESLSDNIIVNNEFNCDAHIVENNDDSNGNKNDDKMEILLYQIFSDQSILMKHLQLRRHPILPQTTTKIWIQK